MLNNKASSVIIFTAIFSLMLSFLAVQPTHFIETYAQSTGTENMTGPNAPPSTAIVEAGEIDI